MEWPPLAQLGKRSTTDMKTFDAIMWLLLIVALIILGPVITIWALNLVFGLNLVTNFATWFAVLWLQSLLVARVTVKK